ncbi:MAG: carbohydrate-binding domain-containing protein [Lachnospiraceae bacterium]|nr:carbohydrate-binding domain-containing protein [Lachnospiraceae bacterium]
MRNPNRYGFRRRLVGMTCATALMATFTPVITAQAYEGNYDGSFAFSEDGIKADGNGESYKIEGTELTISAAGTYLVTGECSEGSIKVKKETEGVILILSDLNLTASETAPLVIAKSAEVKLVIDGSNTLTDREDPADENSEDTEIADAFEGAAIKVKSGSTLVITGDGTLNADGSDCKNGIKGGAEASIIVGAFSEDSFTLYAKAANNALACDGSVTVAGGNLNLTAEGDGLKSSPDEDDTASAGTITMTGGTLVIDSAEDAIQSTGNLTISGGECTIKAGDDGVHSEAVLTIGSKDSSDGPVINITESYEGLEGATVNIYSGDITVRSSDDGVNAANSDLSDYSFAINVTGGNLYVNADGDGLDSNGSLSLTGGVVEVYGSSAGDNAPLDYERPAVFSVDGGTVLAVGNSGMAENPAEGVYVAFGGGNAGPGGLGGMGGPGGPGDMGNPRGMSNSETGSISISNGTTIEIKDSSGNTLFTGEGVKSANYVLFASTELSEGDSYTLYLNGSSVSTVTANGSGTSGGSSEGEQKEEHHGENSEIVKNTLKKAEDGIWYYYGNDGTVDTQKYGFVSYDGASFLVANGRVADVSGLQPDPEGNDWYFLSHGQVCDHTGLVMYDDEWFYVKNGKLDTSLSDFVSYNDGLFFVAAGRIVTEANGLHMDPDGTAWYYLANGQAQTQYTGLTQYDGAWFYVVKGKVAEDYTGAVDYDGSAFDVVNGMVR